jgi:hypothetical protein
MDVRYHVHNSHHWSLSRRNWSRPAVSHPVSLKSTLLTSWDKLYPLFELVIGYKYPGSTYRIQNGSVISSAILRVASWVTVVCNWAEFNVPTNLSHLTSFCPANPMCNNNNNNNNNNYSDGESCVCCRSWVLVPLDSPSCQPVHWVTWFSSLDADNNRLLLSLLFPLPVA